MKALKLLALVVIVLLMFATPVLAAESPNTAVGGVAVGAGFGAGLVMIGAGWGFGRIGATALESMARQPEVANKVQIAMIIIAALLEGATFFALLVCMQINGHLADGLHY